jgi:hypothetical protein
MRTEFGVFYLAAIVAVLGINPKAHAEDALVTNASPTGSLFESLFSSGTMPTAFEDLMNKVNSSVPDARSFVTLIPDTRSLPKDHVSFKFPRALFFADVSPKVENQGSPSVNGAGFIFIGFSEDAKELEVISWNSRYDGGKGGFEFQLVKNFGPGLKPEIVTPPRSSCTVCHQGEAPIFTSSPWRESTGFVRVDENKINVGSSAELNKKLMVAHPSGKYVGIPIIPKGFDIVNFNDSVRQANKFLQSKRFCREACGKNVECRKNLLLYSLVVSDSTHYNIPYKLEETLNKQTTKLWPADDYGFPVSLILDRDPMKGPDDGASGFRTIHGDKDVSFNDEQSSRFDLPDFVQTPLREIDKGLADPKTPRPLGNKLQKGIFPSSPTMPYCLDFLPIHRTRLRKYLPLTEMDGLFERHNDNWKIVDMALDSECVRALYSTWPPNPDKVLEGVLAYVISYQELRRSGAEREKSDDPCSKFEKKIKDLQSKLQRESSDCVACIVSPVSTEVLGNSNKGSIEKIEEVLNIDQPNNKFQPLILKKFQTYCSACHAPGKTATELPLNDWKSLKEWNVESGEDTLLQMLDQKIMPPKLAPKEKRPFPTVEEIEDMKKALRN